MRNNDIADVLFLEAITVSYNAITLDIDPVGASKVAVIEDVDSVPVIADVDSVPVTGFTALKLKAHICPILRLNNARY